MSERQLPRLPPGLRIYAIGDIHGRADLLKKLLKRIRKHSRQRGMVERQVLVFLGDYICRGPDSAGVVERLVKGVPKGFEAVFLKGNHEDVLLEILRSSEQLERWLSNGGDVALKSYGVECPERPLSEKKKRRCHKTLRKALPKRHRKFFRKLQNYVVFGDYLFVHAGLRPGVSFKKQNERDMLWIREEFLNSSERFKKFIIHGHSPARAPVVRSNRIGIDTRAWQSGILSAVVLEGSDREFLST